MGAGRVPQPRAMLDAQPDCPAAPMRTITRFVLASLLALTALSATAAENKWRMQFSGNAESDGAVEVTITPNGDNPPVVVSIPVTKGTSENGVAKAVRDGLRAGLPKGYKVERDDGEDVLVKRRMGTARFTLEVTGNTVKGVRVNLDQE